MSSRIKKYLSFLPYCIWSYDVSIKVTVEFKAHSFSKIVLIVVLAKIRYLSCGQKIDKQIINNYTRPVSLWPVFEKSFWKTFLKIFWVSWWRQIALKTSIWSQTKWFMHKSILSIVYGIYKAFNTDPTHEVWFVFLDIPKVFDKVWLEGLIYKLRQVGISGEAPTHNNSLLNNIFQRVILNG